jgi:hypothetical protein
VRFHIHPIEPLHAFGPCEVNDAVLIARLKLVPEEEPELDILSSSYRETLQGLLRGDDAPGHDAKAWTERLEPLCLTLVEAAE